MPSVLLCAGCGAPPDPAGWACPNRWAHDDIDHVILHHLDTAGLPFVTSDSPNPFVRYRSLLHAYHLWLESGRDDASFVALVDELDDAVAKVEGKGFRRTPLSRYESLDHAVGTRVWVKDETGNVTGSHKGRHLLGLSILLRVWERLGLVDFAPRLAIASCGNAALAAGVVAAAAGQRLEVFVPTDAEPPVLARLISLGAVVSVCERDGRTVGDPCYHAFVKAVAGGAIPFGCQGPDNGLTIEGGRTLGWEIAEQLAIAGFVAQRMVVQVGGGALATSCIGAFRDAAALEIAPGPPTFDCVQPDGGGAPLVHAYLVAAARVAEGLSIDDVVADAAQHRSRYMRSADVVPMSVARGILDDETYDWLAVLRGMLETGGSAFGVDEATLLEANDLARTTTGIDVDPTGSAGLAGLIAMARTGRISPDEDVVVVFSGVRRP